VGGHCKGLSADLFHAASAAKRRDHVGIKSVPYHTPDGDYEITLTVCSYAVNGRLAVNLLYRELMVLFPFATLHSSSVGSQLPLK